MGGVGWATQIANWGAAQGGRLLRSECWVPAWSLAIVGRSAVWQGVTTCTRSAESSSVVTCHLSADLCSDPKYDYGEDEELHVLITGDRQEDVSWGVGWGGGCCLLAGAR